MLRSRLFRKGSRDLVAIRLVRSAALGLEQAVARSRSALERLRRFLRGNDPYLDERIARVGREYAKGTFGIAEAATILELDISDAVALFEEHGYARTLDTMTLSPSERQSAFSRIRRDRQHRTGQPELAFDLVVRDVVATQRIEGIDARPWIPAEKE